MRKSFSERNGYVKPVEFIVKETIQPDLVNSLCTCYDLLEHDLNHLSYSQNEYIELEKYLWVNFLHERYNDFYTSSYPYRVVATAFLQNNSVEWYCKFDLIEKTLEYLHQVYIIGRSNAQLKRCVLSFVENINLFFKDLNYGYRVVDNLVVPVSSEEEIESVKIAIKNSKDNVREHLHTALELYSKRPDADYRNSIKESISAIEAFCRERTGEPTLGPALKKLSDKGIVIPKMLTVAFEKLYAYTNQPDNGIRHALMDEDGNYMPGQEEAMFMLVSCSAFLNYLYSKLAI